MVVTDYNEQFLDKRGTDHLIEELKAYIDSIATGNIDLSDYVTKSELQAKLDALDINIDLSSYATKEELTNAINSIDLSAYALKTEIPSLDGYATTEYVDNAIANVPSGGGTVDLSNYYTKDEVYSKSETDALIPTVTDGVDGITPHIDSTTKHWMIGDTDTGVIAEGSDGVSPTVTVTKEGKVATITCTDVNGTTTATISDGADGSSSGSGGSSSGGITYAFDTEIATGETWVDGKPIYMKVIDFTNVKPFSSSGYNLYMTVYKDWVINEVIDSRIAFRNGDSNYTTENPYQGEIPSISNISKLISNINSYIVTRGIYHNVITTAEQTTIQVFIGTFHNSKTQKIYLTVKYTKP